MLEHKCSSGCFSGWRDCTEFLLFNNTQIKDFSQWHYIETDLSEDEVILKTGMVESKSKLKILKKQGSIKVISSDALIKSFKMICIGQRRLIILCSATEAKMVRAGQDEIPDYFVVTGENK